MPMHDGLPTEPGWYFAKLKAQRERPMECVFVMERNGKLAVNSIRIGIARLQDFQWFGKVPMPVEV